jgi:hypothetical protein
MDEGMNRPAWRLIEGGTYRSMRDYPGWLRLPGLFQWEEVAGLLEGEQGCADPNEFKAVHAGFDGAGAPVYEVFARNLGAESGTRSIPPAYLEMAERKRHGTR